MSRKSINFDDKKIKKNKFYENKKVFQIDDVDVNNYWFQKKNHMAQRMHLNTLLGIMIMMLLDHYVQDFHK